MIRHLVASSASIDHRPTWAGPLGQIVLAALLGICLVAPAAQAVDAPVVIRSDGLSATLDPAQGGAVVSLLGAGTEMAAKQAAPRLFELQFSRKDDPKATRIYVSSHDAARCTATQAAEGGRTVARLAFEGPVANPFHVLCTLTAQRGDPLLRWRLEARFADSLVLEQVRYPILSLRAPLGTAASDALVMGSTKGGIYRNPAAYPAGRSISFRQPGSLAAAMACYYNDERGLFSAMFDPRGYPKGVTATRTAEGLSLAWDHPCFSSANYTLDYDAVLGVLGRARLGHAVDWRDAADLYKQWAERQSWCAKSLAARQDLPAWLTQGPAMVRFDRQWLGHPERVERWLKDYWQAQFPPAPLVIAYWGWEKVDTWVTPDYFPCYPSDEVFSRLVRAGREVGGHTFLWPSGYHYTLMYNKNADGTFAWDDRSRFDATARSHAVCGRDGNLLLRTPSWLKGGQCATMCPGDPYTLDWFNQIATGIVRRGGELVQVDQVVGGSFAPCYSKSHGHAPGPGLWCTDVFRKQLHSMLAECRKINPGAVVCFEEPNEWFLQEVGIQDYRDCEPPVPPGDRASVFNYLYHEYLPTFQSNINAGNRRLAAWCLVNGEIPHLFPSFHFSPEPLVLNGGFEEVSRHWPDGWEHVHGYRNQVYSGQAALDSSQHHGGTQSLRLQNTDAGQMVQVSQNVAVGGDLRPGGRYRLSAWIKSAGTKPPSALNLGAFAEGLKSLGGWQIAMPRGPGAWTRGSVDFTLPAESQMLRLMINLVGPGQAWIDDLTLSELHPDGTQSELRQPSHPLEHDLMRQWVDLFHGQGRPYLLLGKMLHPPQLKTATVAVGGKPVPAVLHNAFQAADDSVAAVLVNATDEPQAVQLTWTPAGPAIAMTLAPWQVRLLRR